MSKIEQGTVPTHEGGIRLDLWLVAHTSISSRSKARKAIASGKVAVGDDRMGTAASGRQLAAGDKVELDWGRSGNANGAVRLARAGVQLLYVDEAIAVANKPAGLLTDTATYKQLRERDSLRKQLRSHLGSQVWPAHRIDRDTTGVVVFARSKELFESMREQWYARTPCYVAFRMARIAIARCTFAGTARFPSRPSPGSLEVAAKRKANRRRVLICFPGTAGRCGTRPR